MQARDALQRLKPPIANLNHPSLAAEEGDSWINKLSHRFIHSFQSSIQLIYTVLQTLDLRIIRTPQVISDGVRMFNCSHKNSGS